MGVFSSNRVLGEGYDYTTEIEPNTHYSGSDGAYAIMTEMVKDDFSMFEAIIGSDIREASMVYAINNEGADYLTEQVEALQEATGGNIITKIKNFLKTVWSKISGLFKNIFDRLSAAGKSGSEIVKKFEKQINEKRNIYTKMKFKWSKCKHLDFAYKLTLDKSAAEAAVKDIITVLSAEVGLYSLKVKDDDGKISVASIQKGYDTVIKYRKMLGDDHEETRSIMYTGYGIDPDDALDASSVSQACHEYFFEDEDEEDGTFLNYKSEIIQMLNDKKTVKDFEKTKRQVDTYFNKEINKLTKLERNFNRNRGEVQQVNGFTSYDTSEKLKTSIDVKIDGETVKRTPANLGADLANCLSQMYQEEQTVMIKLINEQIAAAQFHIKQCRRVWMQAATFNAKAESGLIIDNDVLEAVGEAADYDTDLLFN